MPIFFVALAAVAAVTAYTEWKKFPPAKPGKRYIPIESQAAAVDLTPDQFLALVGFVDDFPGVYIIRNLTKNKCCVGQSSKVLYRASKHITGYGNLDLYKDIRDGDEVTVKCIGLKDSGFESLDELERECISMCDEEMMSYEKASRKR